MIRITIFGVMLLAAIPAMAGTLLDFWHSYTHQPSGVVHYSFHLASYKLGLFFGSCGIGTKSLQWNFDFDLAGTGPVYEKDHVKLSADDGSSLKVVSGQVTIDRKLQATIALVVEEAGSQKQFIGNGKYRIHKLK